MASIDSMREMIPEHATLTYQQFCFYIKLLSRIADMNNDPWQLHGSETVEGSLYAVKKIHPHEKHHPTLCLQGSALHQQHGGYTRAWIVREFIQLCIVLLNEREGPAPPYTVSLENLYIPSYLSMDLEERSKSMNDVDMEISWVDPPRHSERSQCTSKKNLSSEEENQHNLKYYPSNSASQPSDLGSSGKALIPTKKHVVTDGSESESSREVTVETISSEGSDTNDLKTDLNNDGDKVESNHKTTANFCQMITDKILHPSNSVSVSGETFYSIESSEEQFDSDSDLTSDHSGTISLVSSIIYCDSICSQDVAEFEMSSETDENEFFWEYHVLYSMSYRVPIMFFQVWDRYGKIVPLHKLWGLVDYRFQGRLQNEGWSILTQLEHPLLRRPFYYLHPCGTQALLEILKPSWNPIISWLMSIGPHVGLNICPLYGQNPKLLNKKKKKNNNKMYMLMKNRVRM